MLPWLRNQSKMAIQVKLTKPLADWLFDMLYHFAKEEDVTSDIDKVSQKYLRPIIDILEHPLSPDATLLTFVMTSGQYNWITSWLKRHTDEDPNDPVLPKYRVKRVLIRLRRAEKLMRLKQAKRARGE